MTTFERKKVFQKSGLVIVREVGGDLSVGYYLLTLDGWINNHVGWGFASLATAKRYLNLALRHGIKSKEFDALYKKSLDSGEHSGYLSYAEGKKYAGDAYGEVAEGYRRRMR